MASSLNLLVLRLAQFNSENDLGGMSALLRRNREDLIAAAIAEHRVSINIQRRTRLHSNTSSPFQQQVARSPHLSMTMCSSWSLSSLNSQSDLPKNPREKACCPRLASLNCKRRKRRHWHLRRSPQNITHLLLFNQMLENYKLTLVRKSLIPNQYRYRTTDHASEVNLEKQQRISV